MVTVTEELHFLSDLCYGLFINLIKVYQICVMVCPHNQNLSNYGYLVTFRIREIILHFIWIAAHTEVFSLGVW